MKSIYDFIVEPVGEKYSNKVKVGDKELIVNTKIEDFKFVNRLAKVIQTAIQLLFTKMCLEHFTI